jgi:hypothetical protein
VIQINSNEFLIFFKYSKQPSKPKETCVSEQNMILGKSLYSSKAVWLAYMKYGLGFENTSLKIEK